MESKSKEFIRINLLRLLIFALAFLSGKDYLHAQRKIEKPVKIVFVGNSITYGVGFKDPATMAPPVFSVKFLKEQKGMVDIEFSNQARNGATTLDYLPGTKGFESIVQAAGQLLGNGNAQLIISIELGTNDSAIFGPNGSPVQASEYAKNLELIINKLLELFPNAKIILNRPIWYSPNTMYHTRAQYLEEGLQRLQSYFPEIDKLVSAYRKARPNQVFRGDTKAFARFKKKHLQLLRPENGDRGLFYLHPAQAGAVVLGQYWAKAIWKII